MKYLAIANNIKTDEEIVLGIFNDANEAWENINFNLEWDEDDIKEDWQFIVQEVAGNYY
jgi:hypothetical protein